MAPNWDRKPNFVINPHYLGFTGFYWVSLWSSSWKRSWNDGTDTRWIRDGGAADASFHRPVRRHDPVGDGPRGLAVQQLRPPLRPRRPAPDAARRPGRPVNRRRSFRIPASTQGVCVLCSVSRDHFCLGWKLPAPDWLVGWPINDQSNSGNLKLSRKLSVL